MLGIGGNFGVLACFTCKLPITGLTDDFWCKLDCSSFGLQSVLSPYP